MFLEFHLGCFVLNLAVNRIVFLIVLFLLWCMLGFLRFLRGNCLLDLGIEIWGGVGCGGFFLLGVGFLGFLLGSFCWVLGRGFGGGWGSVNLRLEIGDFVPSLNALFRLVLVLIWILFGIGRFFGLFFCDLEIGRLVLGLGIIGILCFCRNVVFFRLLIGFECGGSWDRFFFCLVFFLIIILF